MSKARDNNINIVCTLPEKLAIQNAKADLQLHEGRMFTYAQVMMFLFYIYNSEHKLIDQIRKQFVEESNGALADVTNEDVIKFLFADYQHRKKEQTESQ